MMMKLYEARKGNVYTLLSDSLTCLGGSAVNALVWDL
jgi:hypothetical protein